MQPVSRNPVIGANRDAGLPYYRDRASLRVPIDLLCSVRVDQAAWPKPCHDFGQAGVGDGEATLAATEHPGVADHFLIHVPGPMHQDGARELDVVRLVQYRQPLLAYVTFQE